MIVSFKVYGKPQGKARPRFTKSGRVYTPNKTKEYENSIRKAYISAAGTMKATSFVTDKAVKITIQACYKKPKSSRRDYPTVKPDLDNVVKAVLDGLNGAAFMDDKQVVSIEARKKYAIPSWEEPHIEVWVRTLDE